MIDDELAGLAEPCPCYVQSILTAGLLIICDMPRGHDPPHVANVAEAGLFCDTSAGRQRVAAIEWSNPLHVHYIGATPATG